MTLGFSDYVTIDSSLGVLLPTLKHSVNWTHILMIGKPAKSHHDVATCVNELALASVCLHALYTDPSNMCVLWLGNGSHFISK